WTALLVLLVPGTIALVAGWAVATFAPRASFLKHALRDPFLMTSLLPVVLPAWTVLVCLYVFLPPTASRAAVEAERAWVASLPFTLERYFDVIGAQPEFECRLRVELSWTKQGVDARTLEGIIALFDTGSQVVEARGASATFVTGPISGRTGIRVNRS